MKSVGNKKIRNRIIIGSAVGMSLAFGTYAVFDAMAPRDKAEDTTEVIVVETSEEMMSTGVLAQTLASSETTAVEVTEATTEEIEDEMTTEVESTERTDEEDDTEDVGNTGNTGNTGNSSNGSTGNAGNSGNGGSSSGNGSAGNGSGSNGNSGNGGNSGNSGNGSTENIGNGGSSTTTTESTTTETTETTESDEPSYGDLVWVVDQEACWVEVPVYETVYKDICNGCGMDISNNLDHITIPENIRNGCGGYHLESFTVQTGTELVWQEEQGHWERYGY